MRISNPSACWRIATGIGRAQHIISNAATNLPIKEGQSRVDGRGRLGARQQ